METNGGEAHDPPSGRRETRPCIYPGESEVVRAEDTLCQSPAEAEAVPAADALLVEQVRRRDPDATHRFFGEYYPGVYRYLLWLTERPETAEDLTQETFLRAWRHLDTFELRAPLRV